MSTPPEGSLLKVPRWTEQQAREVLVALEASGKSVRAFAAEHELDPQRIYSWRRRLAGGEPTTFREVIVQPPARLTVGPAQAPFEIALANGAVVRVPASFDAAALTRLLAVLAQAHAC
jgi:hypothetical protein